MTPGELFALCRELKGLSTGDVERKTGINRGIISRLERNKHRISLDNAVALCDLYEVGIERVALTVRGGKRGRK